MSGSKSSAPVDAHTEHVEALDLSVHAQHDARRLMEAERTRRGRWAMLAVVFLCALPVLASYFTFYVVQPKGDAYGELIHPAVDMPANLPLHDVQGRPVTPASLQRQWLLVVVDGGSCVGVCEERLFMQRQLREMLGRERDRLDKVWLVVDDAPIAPALQDTLAGTPALHVLRAPQAAVAAWLQPATGQSLASHLYLVDPQGRWMWRSPVSADPQRVKRDIEKLLRASASWDKAGR